MYFKFLCVFLMLSLKLARSFMKQSGTSEASKILDECLVQIELSPILQVVNSNIPSIASSNGLLQSTIPVVFAASEASASVLNRGSSSSSAVATSTASSSSTTTNTSNISGSSQLGRYADILSDSRLSDEALTNTANKGLSESGEYAPIAAAEVAFVFDTVVAEFAQYKLNVSCVVDMILEGEALGFIIQQGFVLTPPTLPITAPGEPPAAGASIVFDQCADNYVGCPYYQKKFRYIRSSNNCGRIYDCESKGYDYKWQCNNYCF